MKPLKELEAEATEVRQLMERHQKEGKYYIVEERRLIELRAIIADRKETHVEEMYDMMKKLSWVVRWVEDNHGSNGLYEEYKQLIAKLEGK